MLNSCASGISVVNIDNGFGGGYNAVLIHQLAQREAEEMKTLYFDCISGISGDMVIGALIDAGADPNILEEELRKLQIEEEYQLKWEKVIKNGITSTKFDVLLTDKHDHPITTTNMRPEHNMTRPNMTA